MSHEDLADPWPPGHFYSPIPDFDEVLGQPSRLSYDRSAVPGIDLDLPGQMALAGRLGAYSAQFDWPADEDTRRRYYTNNPVFGHGSSYLLFSMIMHFRPTRIIEVGSGFSSALMLDTKERKLDGQLDLVFVEPFPHRLRKLLQETDDKICTVVEKPVQDVDPELFLSLRKDDVLFIDSSHVAKAGSDVLFLYNEIIPLLHPGVLIHVHDIYWPFEYPRYWLEKRWAWNEAYFLRALLQNNARLSVRLYVQMLARLHPEVLDGMPFHIGVSGSSIWLQTN